jgi:hypothetical protein
MGLYQIAEIVTLQRFTAGAASDQVRVGDQPKECQGDRPHGALTFQAAADEVIE